MEVLGPRGGGGQNAAETRGFGVAPVGEGPVAPCPFWVTSTPLYPPRLSGAGVPPLGDGGRGRGGDSARGLRPPGTRSREPWNPGPGGRAGGVAAPRLGWASRRLGCFSPREGNASSSRARGRHARSGWSSHVSWVSGSKQGRVVPRGGPASLPPGSPPPPPPGPPCAPPPFGWRRDGRAPHSPRTGRTGSARGGSPAPGSARGRGGRALGEGRGREVGGGRWKSDGGGVAAALGSLWPEPGGCETRAGLRPRLILRL